MKKEKKETIFVIDGSSYLYRAYFSTQREFISSKGLPTRAIYVITNMILKILREKAPEYLVVAWDAKGPTFRHKLYEEYKANRPPMPEDLQIQVPYIRKIIDALGIKQMELEGYEADDIMAAISRRFGEEKDVEVVLVTGDKDMKQLVSENVILWDPMRDKITDLEGFKREFGISPRQFTDILALTGDTSDNIPGIPGIGPKTALKLIKQFGTIENLIQNLNELKTARIRAQISEKKNELSLWKRLVELDDNIPEDFALSDFKLKEPDKKRLFELFKELDFESLIPLVSDEKTLSYDQYILLRTESELKSWLKKHKNRNELVIDTETSSEKPMLARLVGISLCFNPPEAAYIPVDHEERSLSLLKVKEILGPFLTEKGIRKIGQNIKYDLIVLKRHGLSLENVYGDTMIASYLLDPTKRRHNLDEIARDHLGHQMISYKEVTKGLKKGDDFSKVPLEDAKIYSCEDVHVTCIVKDKFHEDLKKKGLWKLYSRVEIPLVSVLARMEMDGILIDKVKLSLLKKEFSQKLSTLKEKIFDLAGTEFNINSTKQLSEILFEKLNLPQLKKTRKKTGYSTDVEVLKALSKLHPLPEALLKYRNLSKLKSTYIDGIEKEINPETGRVHTSFNQTVTATGRLSSSEPNLQNIPIRTEEGRRIRELFIAGEGNVFVSADYSQIDLRVLAHYSGDENLVEAFKRGEDIHRRTASQIFDVTPEFVTPDMRRIAKTVNFGIIYGMSAYGLSKELDIGRKEAKRFIDAYFERHPGVKRYMEEIVRAARDQGYVETILGRRRYIKDIRAKSRNIRKFAERTAINTPIQGSAADIIKLSMIRLVKELDKRAPFSRLLLQVHDELLVECLESERELVQDVMKDVMENVVKLKVPLTVSIGSGKNWSEIK